MSTAKRAKLCSFPLKQYNGVKADLQLSDSGLTLSWLLDVLWRNCEEFRSSIGNGAVHDVTSKDISEGKGFMSKVYKTLLSFKDAPVDSFTVMMKVPSQEAIEKFGEMSKGTKESDSPLLDVYVSHNIECQVLEAIRDSNAELPLPTVWHTQLATDDTIGVILMPDLSVDSICPGWAYPMSVAQINDLVRHMAVFHAHLISIDEKEPNRWDEIINKKPFWLHEFHGFLHDSLQNIPEYKDGEFKELLRQVAPTMTTEFFRYSLVDRPTAMGLPLLLLQGDAGSHNMFFRKNPDGSASSEVSAIIDWQIAFLGNQFLDITRSIYGFADADARREAEETLVEDYHRVLRDELAKRGRSLTAGLDELREAYALAAIHQSLFAVINPGIFEVKKDEYSPQVFDAMREKFLLRSKLALKDAIEMLKKYAPQYLA